jgi:L-asparaginase II
VAVLVEVTRGDLVESSLRGDAVVVDAAGRILYAAGDPERVAYFRSSAKPFQAVPLVRSGAADAFGFGSEELALACASHDATPGHQRIVARMLARVGLDETALGCGIAPAADEQENARDTLGLVWPSQIRCECSGEHAGMLAACVHNGWPTDGYWERNHPLQQEIGAVVAQVTGVDADALVVGTDGCSLPTFGAPIRAFAAAYAAFGRPDLAPPARVGELGPVLDRLRSAMLRHPDLVGGATALDTSLMQHSGGRYVAKLGAEGLLCLGVMERGWGIAVAVESGSDQRAYGPTALSVLEQLGLAEEAFANAIRDERCGPVTSFKGVPVGDLRAVVALEPRA